MKNSVNPSSYNGLAVISPVAFGGEDKDQDRARWFKQELTGTICDGLTSSPFAAKAAEMAAQFSPVLFKGDVSLRLRVLSDLLVTHRSQARESRFQLPAAMSKAMQQTLQEVAVNSMNRSFQTTLVTAVLPDHFYCGSWSCMEHAFALETHFLLCSDGLYGAFDNPAELWSWLKANQSCLQDPDKQAVLLRELHQQRYTRFGDDDISFVWIYPDRPEQGKEGIAYASTSCRAMVKKPPAG